MLLEGSRVVTAMFASVVWANKSGAALSQQGFKFYNSRFQMSRDWRMLMELVGGGSSPALLTQRPVSSFVIVLSSLGWADNYL